MDAKVSESRDALDCQMGNLSGKSLGPLYLKISTLSQMLRRRDQTGFRPDFDRRLMRRIN